MLASLVLSPSTWVLEAWGFATAPTTQDYPRLYIVIGAWGCWDVLSLTPKLLLRNHTFLLLGYPSFQGNMFRECDFENQSNGRCVRVLNMNWCARECGASLCDNVKIPPCWKHML